MGKPKRQKRSRTSIEGFRGTSNHEQAHWMREFGKSNAAQPHVPAPRKGSRREKRTSAIHEQQGSVET